LGVKKTILKSVYVVVKGSACGTPLAGICFVTLKQCLKDISFEDIPYLACKTFLVTCVPTSTAVAVVGAFCNAKTLRSVKGFAKVVINVAGVIYTGPSYAVNLSLSALEILIFGEEVPVGPNGLALIP
jgi:hypothetical protein